MLPATKAFSQGFRVDGIDRSAPTWPRGEGFGGVIDVMNNATLSMGTVSLWRPLTPDMLPCTTAQICYDIVYRVKSCVRCEAGINAKFIMLALRSDPTGAQCMTLIDALRKELRFKQGTADRRMLELVGHSCCRLHGVSQDLTVK